MWKCFEGLLCSRPCPGPLHILPLKLTFLRRAVVMRPRFLHRCFEEWRKQKKENKSKPWVCCAFGCFYVIYHPFMYAFKYTFVIYLNVIFLYIHYNLLSFIPGARNKARNLGLLTLQRQSILGNFQN